MMLKKKLRLRKYVCLFGVSVTFKIDHVKRPQFLLLEVSFMVMLLLLLRLQTAKMEDMKFYN